LKSLTIVLGALFASASLAQAPCTNEMAWKKPGSWAGGAEDDLAMADPTYPKAEYPAALRKADQVITLLKQAIPKLDGIEAQAYRSIRGPSQTKGGALKYGVNTLFKGYYCVPDTPAYPTLRGQIQLGDETGTWIYIRFNDLLWLTDEKVRLDRDLRAKGGGTLYFFPRQGGEWKGLPLLLPTVQAPRKTEAVIIAPEGRTPYRFITREEFLQARVRQTQEKIDKLPQSRDRASVLATLESERQKLDAAVAALSPEERKAEAIVRNAYAVPGGREKIFTTEEEGGRRVFTVSARFFDPGLPRQAVQFITVYWYWDSGPEDRAKTEIVRQFREGFDLEALRAMLGR